MARLTAQQAEQMLPGDWLLVHEYGWLPLGVGGRLIDTDGWCVVEPCVLAYGHAADRIQRAHAYGKTPRAAVEAFLASIDPANPPHRPIAR